MSEKWHFLVVNKHYLGNFIITSLASIFSVAIKPVYGNPFLVLNSATATLPACNPLSCKYLMYFYRIGSGFSIIFA